MPGGTRWAQGSALPRPWARRGESLSPTTRELESSDCCTDGIPILLNDGCNPRCVNRLHIVSQPCALPRHLTMQISRKSRARETASARNEECIHGRRYGKEPSARWTIGSGPAGTVWSAEWPIWTALGSAGWPDRTNWTAATAEKGRAGRERRG